MAKGKKDVDNKDTRVLYKKSMSSIRTHSRTVIPKSGTQHPKQKPLRGHEYYNDGKKLKRDLSIETEMCIMRNNIINRKKRKSYQEVYSEKSKFSTFTIGDSLLVNDRFEAGNSNFRLQNRDVVSLIVDNFRALLNNWIREYLYDSNDNIEKIDAIREALVLKLEQEVIRVSMSSGILNTSPHAKLNRPRRKLRSLYAPNNINIFNCVVNCSNYTVPFQSKRCRLPNLSISKNTDKPGLICKSKNSSGTHLFKMKTQNNMLVSLQKSKEVLIDSSTYIMLAMSSGSLIRCATRDETNNDIRPSTESLVVKNGPFTHTPIIRPSLGVGCLQNLLKDHCFPKTEYRNSSLVREVYGVFSTQRNKPKAPKTKCICEKYTMTGQSTSDFESGTDHHVRHGYNCFFIENDGNIDNAKQNQNQPLHKRDLNLEKRAHLVLQCKEVSKQEQKLNRPEVDLDRIKQGNYTYFSKNASNNKKASKALVKHIQNIFNYLDTHAVHEEIRLDVHVNVLPVVRDETGEEEGTITQTDCLQHGCNCKCNKTTTVCAVTCGPLDTLPEFCETESSTTKESQSSENQKEIISILDGATNNVKYIMMTEHNSLVSENKECYEENVDTPITNNQQSLYYQINSLKNVIKELTLTTEKIIEANTQGRTLNTLSCSTQAEFDPFVIMNSVQSTQNENTSMNVNNESFALWFTQKAMNRNTVPEIMKQMINAQLKNYMMSLESTLQPSAPEPKIKIKNAKPNVKKEERRNHESKGIQFSYHFAHVNHYSGFKLQKVSKNSSYVMPLKKSSFAYIESESIIKVTDMTSIDEISQNDEQNDVGSCSFPYSPLHVQVLNEKVKRNAPSTVSNAEHHNSDNTCSGEYEPNFNFSSHVKKFNDPSPSHGFNKDNIHKHEQKHEADLQQNDSVFIVLDESDQVNALIPEKFSKKYERLMANQEVKVSERSSSDIVSSSEHFTINNFTDETQENSFDKQECPSGDAARDEITVFNNLTEPQPEIIYKISRNKRQTTPKKRKKYKHAIKVKQSLKKCNHRRLNKKLERYRKEVQTNDEFNINQIDSKFISKKVSLCRMVKEVPAKESLVENLNFAGENINQDHEDSISLSPCQKKSDISYSSQKTLINKRSIDSFENTNSGTGSMFMIIDEPIVSNIINVSRAQIDNLSFNNRKSTPIPSCGSPCLTESNGSSRSQSTLVLKRSVDSFENSIIGTDSMFMILDEPTNSNIINVSRAQINNLTFDNRKSTPAPSCGSLSEDSTNDTENPSVPYLLTSAPESMNTLVQLDQEAYITSNIASAKTLINKHKTTQSLLERDISRSSLNSSSPSRSATSFHMEQPDNSSSDNYGKASLSYNKRQLVDTVIDLGMFPQMTAPRSLNKFSDVIVTERILTKFNPLARNNKEHLDKDDQIQVSRSISMNVVQKSSEPPNTGIMNPKNVKLPNQNTLNDLLELSEKYELKKNKDEWQTNYPSTVAQLWENLIAALNTKVQKIEKSLTDKILTEMKTSLDILDRFKQHVNAEGNKGTPNKQRLISFGHNQDLECSLLVPLQPYSLAKETAVSNIFETDSKEVQYSIEPSFEVLKPALRAAGDSEEAVTDITADVEKPATSATARTNQYSSRKFSIVNFIRENIVVLAGAPVFVVTLIGVYLIINSVASSL